MISFITGPFPIMRIKYLFLFLWLGCVFASVARASGTTPVISGQWVSVGPERTGEIYATREFELTDSRWSVVFRAFADAEARQPLFTLRVGGIYVLGANSAKVAGAYEGVFPASRRAITADSDAGVAMFAHMNCQLAKGREVPLLTRGCGFVPGLMQAMGEYDLVALKNGALFFGDRSGDLTKVRPDALSPFPLVRK